MATWKERRAWRREFKSLGIRQVKAREAGSIWHGEKQQAARRWLREHELMPYVIAMLLAIAIAAIIAFFGGWLGNSSAQHATPNSRDHLSATMGPLCSKQSLSIAMA